ncbi:MAG: hypothetical protein GTO14_04450 [Anaerolineales bacterium]|nr:hypothetical protein [Anaerolineales bacterium]
MDSQKTRPAEINSEYDAALGWLEKARDRFLSAAIAFCDGSISEGQLRAARELLREWEQRVAGLEGQQPAPFLEEQPPPSAPLVPEVIPTGSLTKETIEEVTFSDTDIPPDLKQRLDALDHKITRLEQDFQQGRINASQYRAVRRHYLQQREVALRMGKMHPESDRWQVVLEEGKTSFLMQLNEAACRSVGFYEVKSRERIFVEGEMPPSAEEAMTLLGTFGRPETDSSSSRMFATQIDDGSALLLIPGRSTVCLGVFSQSPPAWQVRALREVHRNFEAVNRATLNRDDFNNLVFPDLKRFVKR